MDDEVSLELRGREVSVRSLLPLWEAVRKRGHGPRERFASGLDYPIAHLTNPRERISWAAFARFLENVGEVLDDDELVEVGAAALDAPVFRALFVPGRLLFDVADVYAWLFRDGGPAAQLFVAQRSGELTKLGPDRVRLEMQMRPGYAPSRQNHLLLKGSLEGLAARFGVSAEAKLTDLVDGASYEIQLARRTTPLGVARRATTWLFAARDAAEELRRANAALHEDYLILQREVESRRRAEEELRRLNEELERRVAERTADLERANRELATANRELSLFSSSVAHDLRTPLRAISGFATAFLEDHGSGIDDAGRGQLDRIVRGADRMGVLIDALLKLSRVTRAEVRREAIDLTREAHSVVDHLRAVHPERRVEARIAEGMTAEGDPELARALLENLFDNAWKFTRDCPKATISFDAEGSVYRLRDNGIGFAEDQRERIFQPFHRLHRPSDFEGTGIGLATVERIVQRHGGRIWAEGAPGAGATFSFTLAP